MFAVLFLPTYKTAVFGNMYRGKNVCVFFLCKSCSKHFSLL